MVLKPKLRLRKKLETSMKKNNKDTSTEIEGDVTEEIMIEIEDTIMKVVATEETPKKEEEGNRSIKRKTQEDHNTKRKKVVPTEKASENPETMTGIGMVEGMINVTTKKKLRGRLKLSKLNLRS